MALNQALLRPELRRRLDDVPRRLSRTRPISRPPASWTRPGRVEAEPGEGGVDHVAGPGLNGRVVEQRLYELFDACDLPMFPWHATPKPRFAPIEPESVGRRFHVVDDVAMAIPSTALKATPRNDPMALAAVVHGPSAPGR